MKRILHKMMPLCCSLLALVAVGGASTACFWVLHQPEVPEALRK